MTRIVKVSLSIVALLLVALLVFTGCGNNEALTAADEAKAAVVTATKDLEAALAKKADAATLAEKVEALTKAINAAETAASDADAGLNAAITAAKASLEENAQTIVSALDAKITEALKNKADKAVVEPDLALLKATIENINTALGKDFIKVQDYVEFSTTVAYYVYELENKWAAINAVAPLYDGGVVPADLAKAYTTAHVVLYRATSMDVINKALAAFDKAMAENPNPIDAIYYGHILPYVNKDAGNTYANAEALYNFVADKYATLSDPMAMNLFANYYDKGNLVLIPYEIWRTELTAAMTDIAGRYLVYPESTEYSDAADITKAETSKTNFATATADCQTAFGTASAAELVVAPAYTTNVARMDLLTNGNTEITKGASAAAADVNALELSDADLAKLTQEDIDQATIDKIITWKNAYDAWVRVFLPALQSNATEDAVARYDANAALVAESYTAIYAEETGLIAQLRVLAGPYLADAKELYMDLVAEKFYDDDGDLDISLVTYASGADIDAAMNGWLEWMEDYTLDLDFALVYEPGQKSPRQVGLEILELKVAYNAVAEAAITAWEALDHTGLEALAAGTTKLNIYNTTVAAALEWVRVYAMDDGVITWNTKVGEDDAFLLITETKNVTLTKAYYEDLVELKDELAALVAYKAGKATELNAALNALANTKLSAFEAGAITKVQALDTAYVAGTHADLPEGVEAAQVAYDAAKTAQNTALAIAIDYGTKITEGQARYDALVAAKDLVATKLAALNAITVDKAQYPHFAAGVQATYEAAITELNNAITAFATLNMNDKETYMTTADAALKEARIIVAHENVCKAEAALKELQINALPSYFDADPATPATDKANYTDKKNALDTAIDAYNAIATEEFDISTAVAALDAAEVILAKEAYFDAYVSKYETAKVAIAADTALSAADKAELEEKMAEIYNEYQKMVNAYDVKNAATADLDALNLTNFKAVVDALLEDYNIA